MVSLPPPHRSHTRRHLVVIPVCVGVAMFPIVDAAVAFPRPSHPESEPHAVGCVSTYGGAAGHSVRRRVGLFVACFCGRSSVARRYLLVRNFLCVIGQRGVKTSVKAASMIYICVSFEQYRYLNAILILLLLLRLLLRLLLLLLLLLR